MARGTIYEIERDLSNLFSASEYDFSNYVEVEFDWVKDIEDTNYSIQYLLECFKNAGMQIGLEKIGKLEIPFFVIDEASKCKYFEDRYKRFQKVAADLTLEEFATGTNFWTLQYLLEDTHGDCVTCKEDTFQTLDRFVRDACDGKYYIGRVFFMH